MSSGIYEVWVLADNYATAGQGSTGAANDIVHVGSFIVNGTPVPVITNVVPSTYPASSSNQTMTINGSNFDPQATLLFNPPTGADIPSTASKLTYVNGGQLIYQFNNQNNVGTWTVRVDNPDGQSSAAQAFTVTAATPAPVITNVVPSTYPASSSNQTMTINGSNFDPQAALLFNPPTGADIPSTASKLTYVNGGQLIYQFNNQNNVGTWTVRVDNPDGQSSAAQAFTVTAATPAPVITNVVPSTYPASSSNQTMTINGSNFDPQAALLFNPPTGADIPSTASKLTYVNGGQLIYQFNNQNDVGTWTVRVDNPDGQSSAAQAFTVTAATPAPVITNVVPSTYPASSSNQTMTINGSNFDPQATLLFNPPTGADIPSTASKLTYVNGGQLIYQFNNQNDVGTWTVRVDNPDGQSSAAQAFTVTAATPAPVITNVVPSTYPASSSNQTMTINGSNFDPQATLLFNPPTGADIPSTASKLTYVNGGQLIYQFNNQNDVGTWTVRVDNPDGSSSAAQAFTVTAATPAPVITNVVPSTYPASSSNQTMTINGSNFDPQAALLFNPPTGADIPSTASKLTYVNGGQLIYQFNNQNNVGTWTVRVDNPDGQSSAAQAFTVTAATPAPVITNVVPSTYPASSSNQTMTINGSNFDPQATLLFNPPTGADIPSTASKLTYVNGGQLIYQFNNQNNVGTWTVRVDNPDGQSSAAQAFTVTAATPAPVITNVVPSTYPASSSNQTMTINGSNFDPQATLLFNPPTGADIPSTASKLTYVNGGQLIYQFNNQNDVGTWTVRVDNPDGQSSAAQAFTVTAATPAPVITNVVPSTYPASSSNQTMTINGSNFDPQAALLFNPPTGADIPSTASKLTYVNGGQLIYQFNNQNNVGTWTVRVDNPDGQRLGGSGVHGHGGDPGAGDHECGAIDVPGVFEQPDDDDQREQLRSAGRAAVQPADGSGHPEHGEQADVRERGPADLPVQQPEQCGHLDGAGG